jgi:hypothetical protein
MVADLRPKMLLITVVNQGIQVFHRNKEDIASPAPIPAVWSSILNKLFPPEATRPCPAITRLDVDFNLIKKFHKDSQLSLAKSALAQRMCLCIITSNIPKNQKQNPEIALLFYQREDGFKPGLSPDMISNKRNEQASAFTEDHGALLSCGFRQNGY